MSLIQSSLIWLQENNAFLCSQIRCLLLGNKTKKQNQPNKQKKSQTNPKSPESPKLPKKPTSPKAPSKKSNKRKIKKVLKLTEEENRGNSSLSHSITGNADRRKKKRKEKLIINYHFTNMFKIINVVVLCI